MKVSLALVVGSCLLLVAAPAEGQARISEQGGDIDIRADAFRVAENVWHTVGRVHVRQGDAELRADRMDVYFAKGESSPSQENIVRIVAEGSVIYNNPSLTARGDAGVYTVEDEQIRLTGRVRLIRGQDVFCGSELVFQPESGRSEFIGGGSATSDPECPGRVRGVISSSESSGPGGEASGAEASSDGESQ
jgi:lipopolysaccharide transport protein LptA